jgi:hypothetical protein
VSETKETTEERCERNTRKGNENEREKDKERRKQIKKRKIQTILNSATVFLGMAPGNRLTVK